MLTVIQHASIASKLATRIPDTKSVSRIPLTPEASDLKDSFSLSKGGLPNATLLYLATLGGAELCNLQDRIGSLEPGKEFDALIVDLRPETGNPKIWWDSTYSTSGDDSSFTTSYKSQPLGATSSVAELQDFLEKFFFCGDDRNISTVFVRGEMVGGKKPYSVKG